MLGLLLALGFIHVFEFKPYKANGDSLLAMVLAYSVALFFLAALLLKVGVRKVFELKPSVA